MNYTTGSSNRRGQGGKHRWTRNQTNFFHTVREGVKKPPRKILNPVQYKSVQVSQPSNVEVADVDFHTAVLNSNGSTFPFSRELYTDEPSNAASSRTPLESMQCDENPFNGLEGRSSRGPSVAEILGRVAPKYVPSVLRHSGSTKIDNTSFFNQINVPQTIGNQSVASLLGVSDPEVCKVSKTGLIENKSRSSENVQSVFSFLENQGDSTDQYGQSERAAGSFCVNSSYKERRSFSFVLETERLNVEETLPEGSFFEPPYRNVFGSDNKTHSETGIEFPFQEAFTGLKESRVGDGVFKHPRLIGTNKEAQRTHFQMDMEAREEVPSLAHATKSSAESFFTSDSISVPKSSSTLDTFHGNRPIPTPIRHYRDLFKTPNKYPSETSNTYSRYDDLFRTPIPNFHPSLPPPIPFLQEDEICDDDDDEWEDGDDDDDDNENEKKKGERAQKNKRRAKPHMQSKPTVSSVTKSTISTTDRYIVVAMTEGIGCAMGEVGLAAMDLHRPILILSQMSDTQTYGKTLSKINVINPDEMLVPHTYDTLRSSSNLFKTVSEKFPDMKIVAVKRQYFSSQDGQQNMKDLCLPEYSTVELIALRKYYALAAMAALIKYVEYEHSIVFAPKSLRIDFFLAEDAAAIDSETAMKLELVLANSSEPSAEKNSLLEVLNHCKTLGGKRKLRMDILQPPSKLSVINSRLEAVEFLLQEPIILRSLQDVLCKFSDVERLLWLCKKVPNFKSEKKTSEMLTNYVLLLKGTLEALPHLKEVLSETNFDYFTDIRDELCDGRLDQMKARIDQTINEDAKLTKGYTASELQRCYAIKEGVNGLLDVARSIYSELISKIQEAVEELSLKYTFALKMAQNQNQGYHVQLTMPKNREISENELPQEFIEIKNSGRTIRFTTHEISLLNMRLLRSLQEIHLISNVVMFEVVQDLRVNVACLYRLCEHISQLDLLVSLSQISSSSGYTKPKFGDILNIKGARHPVLELIDSSIPTPNDVFASSSKNINIITGPNMSGKTIYVLLIPLLQIMAQIGCFVPAVSAEFRITQHIVVKKGFNDCLEAGLSSFTKEVKEMVYALENLTPTSLVIIDELCQGTSMDEGVAVAWGFCEEFLQRPAFTFVATHLFYLTNLSKIFTNVTNYHLEVIEQEGNDYGKLTYTYRLLSGVSPIEDYGIRLMMTTNLPDEIKDRAVAIADKIKAERAASLPVAKTIHPSVLKEMAKIERLESFMNNLYTLAKSDQFTLDIVKTLQRMVIEEVLPGNEEGGLFDQPSSSRSQTPQSETLMRTSRISELSSGQSERLSKPPMGQPNGSTPTLL